MFIHSGNTLASYHQIIAAFDVPHHFGVTTFLIPSV